MYESKKRKQASDTTGSSINQDHRQIQLGNEAIVQMQKLLGNQALNGLMDIEEKPSNEVMQAKMFYHGRAVTREFITDTSQPVIKNFRARVNLDFDPAGKGGFYLGTSQSSADSWASDSAAKQRRTAVKNEELNNVKPIPAVLTYDIPDERLSQLDGHKFPSTNELDDETLHQWQEFIVASRLGENQHEYDYVLGPMVSNPSIIENGLKKDWPNLIKISEAEAEPYALEEVQFDFKQRFPDLNFHELYRSKLAIGQDLQQSVKERKERYARLTLSTVKKYLVSLIQPIRTEEGFDQLALYTDTAKAEADQHYKGKYEVGWDDPPFLELEHKKLSLRPSKEKKTSKAPRVEAIKVEELGEDAAKVLKMLHDSEHGSVHLPNSRDEEAVQGAFGMSSLQFFEAYKLLSKRKLVNHNENGPYITEKGRQWAEKLN